MGILNGSFETSAGDVIAWPSNWDAIVESFGWDYYTGWDAPIYVVETMQYGWAGCEGSKDEFELSDLDNALFDTDPLVSWEDFEEEWDDNENSVTEWDDNDDDKEFDLAADGAEDFEEEWPSRHTGADDRAVTYYPLATTLSDADTRTRLNALKATYNAHRVDTDHHTAADTMNAITSPDATDEASARTLADEMWTDCWAHVVDGAEAYHLADEHTALVKPTAEDYPAADYDEVRGLLVFLELGLAQHLTWADCSGEGYAEELLAATSFGASDNPGQAVVDAQFDSSTSGEVEDYEEKWSDNEDSIAAFVPATHLDDRDFTKSGGTIEQEDFEEVLTLAFPATPSTAGAEVALSSSCGCSIACTGSFSGTAYVETRDSGSATWVRRETITTVPVDVHLDLGRVAVRIYTDTYSSGTPAATLHHEELE